MHTNVGSLRPVTGGAAPSGAEQAYPITLMGDLFGPVLESMPVRGGGAAAAAAAAAAVPDAEIEGAAAQSLAALMRGYQEGMNASDSGTRETTLATVAQTLRQRLRRGDVPEEMVAVAYVNSFSRTAGARIRVNVPFLGPRQNAALARLIELSKAIMETGMCGGTPSATEPYLSQGFATDAMFHYSVLPEAITTLELQDQIKATIHNYFVIFETFYRAFPDKERILILGPLAINFNGYTSEQNAALSNYLALIASLLWRRMADTFEPLKSRQLVIKLPLLKGMSEEKTEEMGIWVKDDWSSMLGAGIVKAVASIGETDGESLASSVEIARFISESIDGWGATIAETLPTAPGPTAAVKASLSFGMPNLGGYKGYASGTVFSSTVSLRLKEVTSLWNGVNGADVTEEALLCGRVLEVFRSYNRRALFSKKHNLARVDAFVSYLMEMEKIESGKGESITAECLQKELRTLLNQVLSDLNSENYNDPGLGGMLQFVLGSFFTRFIFVMQELSGFIENKARLAEAVHRVVPASDALPAGGGGGAAAAAAGAEAFLPVPPPSPIPRSVSPPVGVARAGAGAGAGAVLAPGTPSPPLPPPLAAAAGRGEVGAVLAPSPPPETAAAERDEGVAGDAATSPLARPSPRAGRGVFFEAPPSVLAREMEAPPVPVLAPTN